MLLRTATLSPQENKYSESVKLYIQRKQDESSPAEFQPGKAGCLFFSKPLHERRETCTCHKSQRLRVYRREDLGKDNGHPLGRRKNNLERDIENMKRDVTRR